MVNSFFPWIGGKKLMREIILERFPAEYGRYVEVFGGAGWILFAKEPEPFEVYNDLNSDLTNMFRVVKEKPLAFLKELGFLPLNLMQTCRTIWQANRRLNENGVKDKAALQRAGGAAGKGVIIENKDYEELITQYDREDTFLYLDPPYVGTEKNYAVRVAKMFHKHLCSLLKKVKGKFL